MVKTAPVFGFVLLLLLGACRGPVQPAAAVALPTVPPAARVTPRPPTATAVTFELQPSSTPLPTRTPYTAVVNFAYGPDKFPPGVDPLTGLPAEDPANLDRRPMVIKITNFPRSVRPQWGLTAADHVYEYFLEDEITRFIGVFYGKNASRVGPVRSARFFDEHVVRMYKAIFVFGFADDQVINPWLESDLRNLLVIERPNNCPPLCRIGAPWNNLYADTAKLTEYINDRGTNNGRQDLAGLRFDTIPPAGGKSGLSVNVYFSFVSYNRWDYDPASGLYMRFQETQDDQHGQRPGSEAYQPLVDSLSGEQVGTANVIVLQMAQNLLSETTEIYQMDFIGQGAAYAFRDGWMYPLTWSRPDARSLVKLFYADGTAFPLKPGQTFYEVIGKTSTMQKKDNGGWRFNFSSP